MCPMSELRRLIQAHLDRYGVTRSEFARRAGTTPQTVQNWWDRPTTLPRADHLQGVADVIGLPYLVVLDAALLDAGYRTTLADDVDTMCYRVDNLVASSPEDFKIVAAYVAANDKVAGRLRIAAREEDYPKD